MFKFWSISDSISDTVQDKVQMQWKNCRKSYVAYQVAPILITLSDL